MLTHGHFSFLHWYFQDSAAQDLESWFHEFDAWFKSFISVNGTSVAPVWGLEKCSSSNWLLQLDYFSLRGCAMLLNMKSQTVLHLYFFLLSLFHLIATKTCLLPDWSISCPCSLPCQILMPLHLVLRTNTSNCQMALKFHSCLSCCKWRFFFPVVNVATSQNWGFAFSQEYPKK